MNTITIKSVITEDVDYLTGAVTEIRRSMNTSVIDIAKQLVSCPAGALKLAKALRVRINNGFTLLEAIELSKVKESK